jgi:hypothetical protein
MNTVTITDTTTAWSPAEIRDWRTGQLEHLEIDLGWLIDLNQTYRWTFEIAVEEWTADNGTPPELLEKLQELTAARQEDSDNFLRFRHEQITSPRPHGLPRTEGYNLVHLADNPVAVVEALEQMIAQAKNLAGERPAGFAALPAMPSKPSKPNPDDDDDI